MKKLSEINSIEELISYINNKIKNNKAFNYLKREGLLSQESLNKEMNLRINFTRDPNIFLKIYGRDK